LLAVRVIQKSGAFYLVNYKAADILRRVRFLSRHYLEGEEQAEVKLRAGEEDIIDFIKGVERNDGAFQRGLIRRKVQEILNFYETAQDQPMIPGPVLLYTPDKLSFDPFRDHASMGNLSEPSNPFIIIDGQHRLAGLDLFRRKHPDEIDSIEVPAIVFDGHQEDFAAEMFVIINSTHTRINKSHLVDLMEKVTFGTSPEKKWAAWVVKCLYEDDQSPLQYKINKLGGRSRQEKWILQSELFNEIYRLVDPRKDKDGDDEGKGSISIHRYIASEFGWDRKGHRAPDLFIDYFRAVERVMKDIWGDNKGYKFTTSVTLKALVRVLGDLLSDLEVRKEWRDGGGEKVFEKRIGKWKDMAPDFRNEGFYERFAAKGQVERVRRIHGELARRVVK